MKLHFISTLFIIITLFSCSNDRKNIDTSTIELDINFVRFDQEINKPNTENLVESLLEKHPKAFEIFYSDILNEGSPYDLKANTFLNFFITDTEISNIFSQIDSVFPETEKFNSEIIEGLKRYKYFFPNKTISSIYYINSGFNRGIYNEDSIAMIGLEMYLGQKNEVVQSLGENFPQYLREKMNPSQVVPDFILNWLAYNHYEPPTEETVLGNMISYGKIIFMLDMMLPDYPNHLKLRYSEADYELAEEMEYYTWEYIVEKKQLYSKDIETINGWFNEGPFSASLSYESPDRMGWFMGWKIVEAFMDENPDVTLQELLELNNNKLILRSYKPKR